MTTIILVDVLRKYVDLIGAINDDIIFEVDGNGMSVTSVDKSRVAMINAKINPDAFGLLPDEPTKFAVDLVKFRRAINLGKKDDTVAITTEDGTLRLKIGTNLSMTIRQLPIDRINTPRIPDIAYKSEFGIQASELSRIVKATDGVAPALTFKITHKEITLSAEGDTDSVSMSMDNENIEFLEPSEEGYASTVGLEYLQAISKVMSGSDTVKIQLAQDYPVTFALDTGDIDATYVIAPRIDQ
jgi:DNA polymerase III sliding clamp (beta) subunit (PCNA family)